MCLKKGVTTGRLVVTTAIKVSLIDHDPANWAPLTGSWDQGRTQSACGFSIVGIWEETRHTVSISIERIIAHAMTKRPLLKIIIKPIFFNGLSIDPQSIGSGIEMRYRSVVTFITRLMMITNCETAGWQKSR